jgi:thiol-disulfide isomerase/thioredoxin
MPAMTSCLHPVRALAGLWLAVALLASAPAQASYEITPWPRNKAVPVLALDGLDGQAWTAARLKGKVVVLNFWATWCEPCRAEMPSLNALAQRHPHSLAVLAVNYQEGEPRIRRYLQTVDIRLPILLDRDGAVAKAWTRRIFPTTVIVDATGKPRFVVTGEYDWAGPDAARLIEPLLRNVSR